MSGDLLTGSLLTTDLTPVRGGLEAAQVYRLKLTGAETERTIRARLYTPPEEGARGVLSRIREGIRAATEGYFWKVITVQDSVRGTIQLQIKISSAKKFLISLGLDPSLELAPALQALALEKKANAMGLTLMQDSDRLNNATLVAILNQICSLRAHLRASGKDARICTATGELILYSAASDSIQFSFGEFLIDYDTQTIKSGYLVGLSSDERRELFSYLEANHAALKTRAQKNKELGGPGVIYISPKEAPIPRAIQIDATGKEIIHFNREKSGDKKLGQGGNKKVKTAQALDTGVKYASISSWTTENLGDGLKRLRQFPHSIQYHGISYDEKEIGKIRFLMELCDGDLSALIYPETEDESAPSLPIESRLALSRDAIVSLRELHEKGYIHRDIKPANFMSVKTGSTPRLLLGDHDSMCLTTDEKGKTFIATTYCYLAPELLQAEMIADPEERLAAIRASTACASDVWALGCTLYQIITQGCPNWFIMDEKKISEKLQADAVNDALRQAKKAIATLRVYFNENDLKKALIVALKDIISQVEGDGLCLELPEAVFKQVVKEAVANTLASILTTLRSCGKDRESALQTVSQQNIYRLLFVSLRVAYRRAHNERMLSHIHTHRLPAPTEPSLYQIVYRMLDPNPKTRITLVEAEREFARIYPKVASFPRSSSPAAIADLKEALPAAAGAGLSVVTNPLRKGAVARAKVASDALESMNPLATIPEEGTRGTPESDPKEGSGSLSSDRESPVDRFRAMKERVIRPIPARERVSTIRVRNLAYAKKAVYPAVARRVGVVRKA